MNNLLTFVDPMQLNKEVMPVFGGGGFNGDTTIRKAQYSTGTS